MNTKGLCWTEAECICLQATGASRIMLSPQVISILPETNSCLHMHLSFEMYLRVDKYQRTHLSFSIRKSNAAPQLQIQIVALVARINYTVFQCGKAPCLQPPGPSPFTSGNWAKLVESKIHTYKSEMYSSLGPDKRASHTV